MCFVFSLSLSRSVFIATVSYISSHLFLNSVSLLLSFHLQFLLCPNLSTTRPFVFFKHKRGFRGSTCAYSKEFTLFSSVLRNRLLHGTQKKPSIYPLSEPCETSISAMCNFGHHFLSDCFPDKALLPFSFQPTSHLKKKRV